MGIRHVAFMTVVISLIADKVHTYPQSSMDLHFSLNSKGLYNTANKTQGRYWWYLGCISYRLQTKAIFVQKWYDDTTICSKLPFVSIFPCLIIVNIHFCTIRMIIFVWYNMVLLKPSNLQILHELRILLNAQWKYQFQSGLIYSWLSSCYISQMTRHIHRHGTSINGKLVLIYLNRFTTIIKYFGGCKT